MGGLIIPPLKRNYTMKDELQKVMDAWINAEKLMLEFNKMGKGEIYRVDLADRGFQVNNATLFGEVTWEFTALGSYPFKATTIVNGWNIYSIHNKEDYEKITGKHFTL
jgi:hypothetical protein